MELSKKSYQNENFKTVFKVSFFLCLSLILYTNISLADENILSFYNKAYSKIQSPPDQSDLSIICQKKIDNLYVSFVGVEKGKVLLASITAKKLKKPENNILLKVFFAKSLEKPILPTHDYVVDWGYVFDRNRDGKIDYVAYHTGPIPVKQKDFPPDYPKRGETVNFDQFGIFLDSNQLVFTHRADDNYDGKVDAVVVEAMDPERDWLDGWMLLRSSNFDGVPDEGWYFKDDINVKMSEAERSDKGFRTRRIRGFDPIFGPVQLADMSWSLTKFNKAVRKCKLTSSSLYQK